jgi:cytochrome c peroxidase
MRRATLIALCLLLVLPSPALALRYLNEASTLPPGSRFGQDRDTRPREVRTPPNDPDQAYLAGIGAVAFHSPRTLGLTAERAEVSCATCHPGGHSNTALFIPGLSARSGSFDTTNGLFHAPADDGVLNPIDTPSLRGLRHTAPYGRDGRFPTIESFVRHVITEEFGGPKPTPLLIDALVVYLETLDATASPVESEAARRGEALFRQPWPGFVNTFGAERPSCAACHDPERHFTDGETHDIGSGGAFDTPSLLTAGDTAPYFHDGRFTSLAEVVAWFDTRFDGGLGAAQRADLVAYLKAIGSAADEPVSLASDLARLDGYAGTYGMALERGEIDMAREVFLFLDRELAEVADHFLEPETAPARDRVFAWRRALRGVQESAEAGDLANDGVAGWRDRLASEAVALAPYEPLSLYDGDRRRAFLASRTGDD